MKFARLFAVACGLLLGCYCFAQNLTGVSVSPASVPSGTPSIGTVTLSAPAPTGGVVVGLSSNAPAATVPTGVTVPQGATSATFSVGAHNSGYTKLAATITATKGAIIQSASLTVNPGNYSSFVSQTVPSSMVCGQSYLVTLQFKNTGTTTWDAAHFYKLMSRNPADNLTWGTKRLNLQNAPVAPGATGIFSGTVIAPATAGTFNFQWECLQDSIYVPFGPSSPNLAITTTLAADAARFVSQTGVPTSILEGATFQPSITFKNVGTATWTAAANYFLSSRNPYANLNWGINRVNLSASVAPQTNVTFTPTLTAPSTPGTYAFQWSMIHNSGFGDMPQSVNIVVTSPDNASYVSEVIGTSYYAGMQFYPQFTFKNTGTSTWIYSSGYWSISANPLHNTTLGVSRGYLPYNLPVAPGANVTIVPHVTAPTTPGTYTMQWQMSKNDVPFGQMTAPVSITVIPFAAEDAQFVSQTVPVTATAGQHYIAQVTFKNNGTADWPLNTAVAQYPGFDGKWALKYVPTGSAISVGNSRTYTLDMVAPYTPGTYALQLRMRDMNTNTWFGQISPGVNVNVSASPYAASPWPAYKGGRWRGSGRGYGFGATGTVAWSFNVGGLLAGSPAIEADGTVVFGTDAGVYALNGQTGAQKWFTVAPYTTVACPAVGADGTVYVAGSELFYALNGDTGQVKWTLPSNGNWGAPQFGPDGTLYVNSPNNHSVYAIDTSTHQIKWSFVQPAGDFLNPVIVSNDGTVYVTCDFGGPMEALDGQTGAVKWSLNVGTLAAPAIGIDGTL
jgi:outer membrane protein assembly factor BamB